MTLALLLIAVPTSTANEAEERDGDDFRSYVDQARFFIKNAWFPDAAEQLKLAIATDDGKLDPEAWFLLANVRYQLADLAGAREAADRALVNSRSEDQTRQAESFLAFLDQQFGVVDLSPPRPGVATHLHVELKRYFNKLTERLKDKITLPYPLGLPAGRYAINGDLIEVTAGGRSAHDVSIRGRGPTGLQLLEAEASFGIQTLFGSSTAPSIPLPQFELGFLQPLGLAFLGATAAWTVHPVRTPEGIIVAPTGWSGGAKVGVHPGREAISLRPALTGRYGAVPGIRLSCSDAGDAVRCEPAGSLENGGQIEHATGHGAMVGGELALVTGDRTRRRGLGAGLKSSVDGLWGRLPEEGELLAVEGMPSRRYRVDPAARGWSAIALRVHFGVSYSF